MNNIQDKLQKIHQQYGVSEKANYEIQLLCEQYAKEYHENAIKSFCDDGKLKVIYENGQPFGIRDTGGYLMFFPKVTKYTGQEQRYVEEIQECYSLAEKIMNALR